MCSGPSGPVSQAVSRGQGTGILGQVMLLTKADLTWESRSTGAMEIANTHISDTRTTWAAPSPTEWAKQSSGFARQAARPRCCHHPCWVCHHPLHVCSYVPTRQTQLIGPRFPAHHPCTCVQVKSRMCCQQMLKKARRQPFAHLSHVAACISHRRKHKSPRVLGRTQRQTTAAWPPPPCSTASRGHHHTTITWRSTISASELSSPTPISAKRRRKARLLSSASATS